MSEEKDIQVTSPPRPTTSDNETWKIYWKAQGQPWRTEPEIDEKRIAHLAEQRRTMPDIEQGIYPFKDIKLSRADVEWLLATHENGRGPVDWNDLSQRSRQGIDLRGADLRQADLHGLPLACTCAGLTWLTEIFEWLNTTSEIQDMAIVHLERANLKGTHLEGANFTKAYLSHAYLVEVHLEEANLSGAIVVDAYLIKAHLEDTNLTWTHLEGANLIGAHLKRANCKGTFFNANTSLENVHLGDKKSGFTSLVDIRWGGVDLSVIDWLPITVLGSELEARQQRTPIGTKKDKALRLKEYETAVRANRQLATVLRSQGLNEQADQFAYQAQVLQRLVWRRQRKPLKYILSWFLYLLAGYGYRPIRSLFAYVLMITMFSVAYSAFGHIPPLEAFVFSLTSFHGRGFFPGTNIALTDPRVVLAAFEAVIGLLIEISFIATFTQRFFGK